MDGDVGQSFFGCCQRLFENWLCLKIRELFAADFVFVMGSDLVSSPEKKQNTRKWSENPQGYQILKNKLTKKHLDQTD